MRTEKVTLAGTTPGTVRELTVWRFGRAGGRPKAYLQAAIHADELPGVLVLGRLARKLSALEQEAAILGEVVLVPVANPAGLAQHVLGRSVGRYTLGGGSNFNRHFPDLRAPLAARVEGRLGDDPQVNVDRVRQAFLELLDELDPSDEADALRIALVGLAADADIVLDLHCDSEALLHVYLGTPLWPEAADLPAELGAEVTLLAEDSGATPFDEAVAAPWWYLASLRDGPPVPPACLGATVELRGDRDVGGPLVEKDAAAIERFLRRRGVLVGEPGALPALAAPATPLAGVDLVRAPLAGVLCHLKRPGERVTDGEVVGEIVDPLTPDHESGRTPLASRTTGVVFARAADRMARPGQVVVKIAGPEPLPGRCEGALLSD